MNKPTSEALLLGSGVTALGALRCLAKAGVPTRVGSEEPFAYRRSRWCRLAPPLDTGLSEYLHSYPRETAVLIPCSDSLAREVARLPSGLRERFPASVPPLSVLDLFLDKGLFSRLLADRDVPHPETLIVDDAFDPGRLDHWDQYFLKPRNSQLFQRRFGVKAFFPASAADLAQKLRLVRGVGLEVILQEYIPGPSSSHYFVDGFVDAESKIPAVFVRRRLRMYPPRFGNSSFMVTVPRSEATQAVEDLIRLLKAVRYRGVFSAEFKKDDRDGVFKILEVNARPWWFVEFAANCGVNVVEMAYRDALGYPVDEVKEYKVGKRFIHPYFDISACARESVSRFRGLAKFLGALFGADQPVFRWNDPMPAVSAFSVLAQGYLRRRFPGGQRRE